MVNTNVPVWGRIPPGRGSCPSGKVAYGSRKQARKAARDLRDGGRPRPYTCPMCGRIHLGHKPVDVRNGTRDKSEWLHDGREPR